MKSARNFKVLVVIVAAGALLLSGLAEMLNSGIGTGLRFGGRLQNPAILLSCRALGALGVVWLGWYVVRLVSAITSIAAQPGGKEGSDNQKAHSFSPTGKYSFLRPGLFIKQLEQTVKRHPDCCANGNEMLQDQVRDLQMQLRLSERQKRNTEAIIYSIRDAVIVTDELDRLLMANEAAGRLFHFDYRDCQHKPLRELVDSGKSEFADFLSSSMQTKGHATRREIEFVAEDKRRTFDCIASCVYDQKDKICGVVVVLHDVTREKDISQMKNDFVSHVSHELKTPLASITAYSEMLCEGEANDEQTRKEFYSVIQSQAKRLNRLIEDILNIARIESGLIKVQKEPVSLTILIEEQLQMIQSWAAEKGIDVIGQKPIVFDQVYVDKDMMSQVIVNLLSNAVKYTPSGGSVTVKTEVDEIVKIVRVSVTDTGVGIPEDATEHLFDKFYRVEANKSQAKGTGLGLNLVKQIVEKVHNGRMFVRSKVGQGSTFGFELPLAQTGRLETVKSGA